VLQLQPFFLFKNILKLTNFKLSGPNGSWNCVLVAYQWILYVLNISTVMHPKEVG
jgi:hypothetical protein